MRTAAEYLQRISEIVGDDVSDGKVTLTIRWSNRAEADVALGEIRRMQGDLRELARDVTATMKEVRSRFQSQKVSIGTGFGHGVAIGIFGRRTMGKMNAIKRDSLREQQIAAIQAYENAKRTIASVMKALADAKDRIQSSEEYAIRSPPNHAEGKPSAYSVRIGGVVKGPFSLEQLRGLVLAGAVTQDTRVQVEGVEGMDST